MEWNEQIAERRLNGCYLWPVIVLKQPFRHLGRCVNFWKGCLPTKNKQNDNRNYVTVSNKSLNKYRLKRNRDFHLPGIVPNLTKQLHCRWNVNILHCLKMEVQSQSSPDSLAHWPNSPECVRSTSLRNFTFEENYSISPEKQKPRAN